MATFAFTDAYIMINSVDLSDHGRNVKLDYKAEVQDDTAFGDTTRSRKGGLTDWTVTAEFAQDFAAAKVDATLKGIVGDDVAIKLRPTTSSIAATNPEYQGTGVVESYPPMGNTIGDLATTTVVIRGKTALVRDTTP